MRILSFSAFILLPSVATAAPVLSVDGECGASATITVTDATAGGDLHILWGSRAGSDRIPVGPCDGTSTSLRDLRGFGTPWPADATGSYTTDLRLAPSFCGKSAQILDVSTCELSDLVVLPGSSVVHLDCDYDTEFFNGSGCESQAELYNAGYAAGSEDGYDDGYADAFSSVDATYEEGYADAYDAAFEEGVATVSLDGYYLAGFDVGYDEGFMEGTDVGHIEGSNIGFDMGGDDFYCEGDEPEEEEEESSGPRLRIQFEGYAVWTQDVTTMDDWDQDVAMHAACDSNFPGSSALTLQEVVEGRTRDMPMINDSGYNVVPACNDLSDTCFGSANDAAAAGHNRQCVASGWAFPEKIFPPSVLWEDSCGADSPTDQAAVCVTYEEPEGEFVVAEGRRGNYGQELWIIDPYTGDTEIIGEMTNVPVTGLSYDEYGNLWYVQAMGWGLPEVGIMDPYTGEQEYLFNSGHDGPHSGFAWKLDQLFFWTENGDDLHEMDPLDGSDMGTLYGNGSYDMALCSDIDGNMYRSTGNDIYLIDEDGWGEEYVCGVSGWPGTSGNDCTFHEGEFYMISGSSSTRTMWHIDLDTCDATDTGILLPEGADALAGVP